MQEARPRRLGERTVDYGLAAMDFCGTLPRTAAGRHVAACGRIVPATVSPDERSEESPKAMSIRGAASSAAVGGEEMHVRIPLNAGLLAVGC